MSVLPARGFRRQTARASRLLLHWTAADGVLTPLSEQTLTFARASAGTARDAAGRLRTLPHSAPRWHLLDTDGDGVRETPTLLLEPAATNAWTAPEDLSNAAWTLTGATVTANAALAPNGTLTADKLAETAVTSRHAASQTLTGTTASTRSCVSASVRAGERTWLVVQSTDKANVTAKTWINLATGALGTKAGAHTVWIEPESSGYRVSLAFDVGTGATTPAVAWGGATANGTDSYLGVAGSGLYLWGLQAEIDRPYPTSYAPSARVVDALTLTAGWPLQDLTVYAAMGRPSHADASGALDRTPYVWSHGASGGPRVQVAFNQASRALLASVTDGALTSQTVTAAIPAGATLEVCAQFADLLTAPRCRLDVGAGFGSYSATVAAFASLATTAQIGDAVWGPGNALGAGLARLKIAAGAQTLAAMRSAF